MDSHQAINTFLRRLKVIRWLVIAGDVIEMFNVVRHVHYEIHFFV